MPLKNDLRERRKVFVFSSSEPISTTTHRLRLLAKNPLVHDVVLPLSRLIVGLATVDELRNAIHFLRDANKHVTVHLLSTSPAAIPVFQTSGPRFRQRRHMI